MVQEQQQVNQSNLIKEEEEAFNPELSERQKWKERLREEILEEEKERIRDYVDFEVNKKLLEIEKLLQIGGRPARLVLVPAVPQYEDGIGEREIVSDPKLRTGTGLELSAMVVGLEGGDNGENGASDGSKLVLGLEKDDDIGEDSKKDLQVEGDDNGENGESDGSKLGLGLEKDDDGENSKNDRQIEDDDNGESDGSKLGSELEKDDDDEDSKNDREIEGDDNGESDGSKLGLGLDKDHNDMEEKKEKQRRETTSSPHTLGASSGEKNKLRAFTISKAHIRPTKKRKTPEWKCALCNVTATSEKNLEAHFKGKKHLAKSSRLVKHKTVSNSKIKDVRKEIKMQVNGKLYRVFEKSNGVWCEKCNWSCGTKTKMSLHLCGSEHESNEKC